MHKTPPFYPTLDDEMRMTIASPSYEKCFDWEAKNKLDRLGKGAANTTIKFKYVKLVICYKWDANMNSIYDVKC